MRYGIYQGVRDSAWQCLLDNNVSSFPIDVLGIAKRYGVRVIKNTQSSVLSTKEHGRTFFDGDGWYIFYNDFDTTERSRFTLAHELGHILLGHDIAFTKYSGVLQFSRIPKSEQQADMFATRLLCPSCVIWALDLHSADDIARYCRVPTDIAKVRAKRMEELYVRNKFLTSDLEKQLYNNFADYIRNNRRTE